jgi:hypothetical protein
MIEDLYFLGAIMKIGVGAKEWKEENRIGP